MYVCMCIYIYIHKYIYIYIGIIEIWLYSQHQFVHVSREAGEHCSYQELSILQGPLLQGDAERIDALLILLRLGLACRRCRS